MKLDHVYTVATFKYTGLLNIRTGILDYLREGFPWPFKHTQSNSFKHTESNSFKHTAIAFKIYELDRTGISCCLLGPRGLARPPHI